MNIQQPFDLLPNTRIKNRLLKSAMSEQLADAQGNPTPEMIHLYERWAQGGIGISITGNVMVDRQHLGEPKNVVLDEHSDLQTFKALAAKGSQNNTQLWMQLNHPGRQIPNFLNKQPVAPSAIGIGGDLAKVFNKPRALTHAEIIELIAKYAKCAGLAKACGFQGVQIHSAHGYLVNQFLSPSQNTRDDQWGGTLDNRMRFLLEIYRAVRHAVGDNFVVAVKLNSADFMEGGFSEQDSMIVLKKLEEMGVDFIEISGGTYEAPVVLGDEKGETPLPVKESTKKREAYFLEYAQQARRQTCVPLALTGGFRSVKAMNAALAENAVDFVGIARPMAIEPGLPNKALADENYVAKFKRPATSFDSLNRMLGLDLVWFEEQLLRLGQGKAPKYNLSPWYVIAKTLWMSGTTMFKQRRS